MKINRKEVYKKYNGHCAYCGRVIELRAMQVDHMVPKMRGGTDDIENLMPACRLCNHYKRAESLDYFREAIETIPKKLIERQYIYKVGSAYGFWNGEQRNVIFYFEKENALQAIENSNKVRRIIEDIRNEIEGAVANNYQYIPGEIFYDTDDYQMIVTSADVQNGKINVDKFKRGGGRERIRFRFDPENGWDIRFKMKGMSDWVNI